MIWLWLGVLFWSGVHAMPSLAPGVRASLIERLGAKGYQIGFALAIFGSIFLMVLGWRSTAVDIVYDPPAWGRGVASLLTLLAFWLFAFSHGPSTVKRFIRHPQLTAMVVWAIGHLLANGDSRSVVLFGMLGLWALIEMVLLNRRDGEWIKPDARPLTRELRPLVIGTVVFVVFAFLHPYLFGVSPFGA